MTYVQYKLLQELLDKIYDMFYDKAEHIDEVGKSSDYVELTHWVKQKHEETKSWANYCNAEDEVLKEIDYDFNYLLNELYDAMEEN